MLSLLSMAIARFGALNADYLEWLLTGANAFMLTCTVWNCTVIPPLLFPRQIRFVYAQSMDKYTVMLRSIDYKFTIIPAVFVGLRIWSCILGILYDYVQLNENQIPSWISVLLIYFAVSCTMKSVWYWMAKLMTCNLKYTVPLQSANCTEMYGYVLQL